VSNDNGTNWGQLYKGATAPSISALVVLGTNLFAGTVTSGVMRRPLSDVVTADPDTATVLSHWNAASAGLSLNAYYVSSLITNGVRPFATTLDGILFSANNAISGGTDWRPISTNSKTPITTVTASGPTFFAATDSGIVRSTDNGITWTDAGTGLAKGPTAFIGASGSYVVAERSNVVYLTSNGGTSWSTIPAPTGLRSFLVAGANLVLASGSSPYISLSTDAGLHWNASNTGIPYGPTPLTLFLNNGVVYAGMQGVISFPAAAPDFLFRSTNNGTSWIIDTAGFASSMAVRAFAANGSAIYAATSGGVYMSTNGGTKWYPNNTNLGTLDARGVVVAGQNLLVGTNGGGIFRRTLADMLTGVEENRSTIAETFRLEQNYPNPFNPTTRIAYVIPSGSGSRLQVAGSDVRLTIYDVLGRSVAVLVDGVQTPGRHEVTFDARRLSSGVYFYRLQSGNYADTRRMVLVK
jgi:hypothetical protein